MTLRTIGTVFAAALTLQAPTPHLKFDAVSIKAVPPSGRGSTFGYTPGRMSGTFTAKILISLAFGTPDRISFPPRQIVGGPDWIDTTPFDIRAEVMPDAQMITSDPRRFGRPVAPYLRSMLEERFRLATHMGTMEFPVYALVVARSDGRLGPKLHASTLTAADCDARLQHPIADKPPCGSVRGPRPGTFTATRAPIAPMISMLGPVDRAVLDRTGLSGLYDAEFQRGDDTVSIFTDVQEQLGLKLEPARQEMEVIVIDHIEMPTPD